MAWRLSPLPFPWKSDRSKAPPKRQRDRLASLLGEEHPELAPLLTTVKAFDTVLGGMGLLSTGESLATRIAWWPTISVLGLYSAGKSTFINRFLGATLQDTGSQAVDDRFTVICYGGDSATTALPGSALNADPRFPFFRVAERIDRIAANEGRHIDSYLQLKACPSPRLKGRLLIDSPGLDAGGQREATLGIIEHIVDISDLVLVFFDARRPEPCAMRETLVKLVGPAARGPNADKLLYVLNHCDSTAHDDNLSDCVGAWQRGLVHAGLAVERFFLISNLDRMPEIGDPADRARVQALCDHDGAELYARIAAVGTTHGPRLAGQLDALALSLSTEAIPHIQEALTTWKREVLLGDGAALAGLLVAAAITLALTGVPPLPIRFGPVALGFSVLAGLWAAWHLWWQSQVRGRLAARLPDRLGPMALNPRSAFLLNSDGPLRAFRPPPTGLTKAGRAVPLLRQAIVEHLQIWASPPPAASAPAPTKPGRANAARPRPVQTPIMPLLQAESLLTRASALFTNALLAPSRRKRAKSDVDDVDFFSE